MLQLPLIPRSRSPLSSAWRRHQAVLDGPRRMTTETALLAVSRGGGGDCTFNAAFHQAFSRR